VFLLVAYSCGSYYRNAPVFINQSRFNCSSVRIAASTFVYKGVFLGCGLFFSNTLFLPCILFCGYSVITRILYIFVFCHRFLFQDYVLSVVRHISEHKCEVRFNKDFIFVLLLHRVMKNNGWNTFIHYFNI
jgi:hypothetical protein